MTTKTAAAATGSTYAYDDAYGAGFDAGQIVPANPPSNEQAWSDFRAESDRGTISYADDPEVQAEYVRGHIAGQTAEQSSR